MSDVGKEARQLAGGHLNCEDCWYSCPKSVDGCCNDAAGDECNCGADARAVAIDLALTAAYNRGRLAEAKECEENHITLEAHEVCCDEHAKQTQADQLRRDCEAMCSRCGEPPKERFPADGYEERRNDGVWTHYNGRSDSVCLATKVWEADHQRKLTATNEHDGGVTAASDSTRAGVPGEPETSSSCSSSQATRNRAGEEEA